MLVFVCGFVLGVILLQQQPDLPSWAGLALPCALSPALLLPERSAWLVWIRRAVMGLTVVAAGFYYAAGMAEFRLRDALPDEWQGRDISVIGVVAALPGQHAREQHFAFDVESCLTPGATVPRRILLSTYENERSPAPLMHAGERWRLVVRLKQPHGTQNPQGFDFEVWMLERRLRASGYVRNGAHHQRLHALVPLPSYRIEHWREILREQMRHRLGDAPYAGVLIALAVGDQDSISAAQWQVFTRTGVNHLMSISGLHITLLASLVYALVLALWRRIPVCTLRLPARKAALVISFPVALAYALLSGFSIPAQRTVLMLAVVALALWQGRNVALSQVFACALLVVLLFDPWAVMAPGFWLSFGAVALIFYVTAHRLRQTHWLREYVRIQWAMTVGLIPLLLVLFQQVSVVSPLANALAIPLISLIVVPLTLLGMLSDGAMLLSLAHTVLQPCMQGLNLLNQLPTAVWTQHAPPLWAALMGMLGGLWCLAPAGVPSRWLGLLVMMPMFVVSPAPPSSGSLRLTVFDVGQGLAVAVQTPNHALLYDAGPAFSNETDSGVRIVVPGLRAQGITQLDGMMLSHDDIDHTGGALSVMQAIPTGWLASSLPHTHSLLVHAAHPWRCKAGQHWQWDGVDFSVLHPSSASYTNARLPDNARSCVLRIQAGRHTVLLTGDIEKSAEYALTQMQAEQLAADVLIVPHHGSKTSSTAAFVAAVHPRYAVFTAGYRNRFKHPAPVVVQRYFEQGSKLLRSDADGALLMEIDTQGVHLERYRLSHKRYWHHAVPH